MKKFLTATLFCSLLISVVKAQMPMIDSFPYRTEVADMRLHVAECMPKGYKMEFGWDYRKSSVADARMRKPIEEQVIISDKNKNIKILCYFPEVYTVQDSINIVYTENYKGARSPNYMHNNNVEADISISRSYHAPLNNSVHYYSFAESRRLFNADTVITYAMNMNNIYKGGVFQDKYTHQQVYVIHRRDRGFFALYCFTTDKGQRDFKKHFRALQKVFRYED